MRVAVVVSTFPPYRGGMGDVAAAHAEALRDAGHGVVVFAPGSGLSPLLRIGNAAVVPQLFWKLRGFDAVELHYPFFGGAEWVWLWKKCFGRRARLAVMYHMDTVGRGLHGFLFRCYRRLFLGAVMRAADAVLVSSREYLVSSQAAFLKDDPRVREIPFSVDLSLFAPGRGDGRGVLFVGSLDSAHYFKGVPVLIGAFSKIAPEFPEVELRIVGDGDVKARYEAQAAATGYGKRIRFPGRVDEPRLAECFRRASVHVLPSTDRSEAFGLVTLKAAASGIPSIVSDLPGVRTLVDPGVTGLLVPPSDTEALASAMRTLLGDPARAASMGRSARERVERRYAPSTHDRAIVGAVCG